MRERDTTVFKPYNAVMQGYVLVPAQMLEDLDSLNESYDYVMLLAPK